MQWIREAEEALWFPVRGTGGREERHHWLPETLAAGKGRWGGGTVGASGESASGHWPGERFSAAETGPDEAGTSRRDCRTDPGEP